VRRDNKSKQAGEPYHERRAWMNEMGGSLY
jgi:hypothetical protein